jgi:ssDNA-binding Zn-finger/Zn-ribbon topoisomerase 1
MKKAGAVAQEARAPAGGTNVASEALAVAEVKGDVALAPREQAGTLAMATMSEAEFQQRLAALKKGQDRIKQIKRDLMEEGAHYGVIPGTNKPTLLKPGAEVLCSIYGLRADFLPTFEYGDNTTAPAIRVSMRCELHLGDLGGPVVAVGYGTANAWERKHRYRRADRSCPACGEYGSIRRSKFDKDGDRGWWCKNDSCKVNFRRDDPSITEQQAGEVENPDPHELENTLLKMGEKRAFIDAALRATASSDLFTQDVEDMPEAPAPKPAPRVHDAEVVDDYPNRGDAAYTDNGIDPPAPARAQQSAGPACPKCGKPTRPSKFPRPGAEFFCSADKTTVGK